LSTEKNIYNLSFPLLFLTFWLLFGQAKSNKACMADAKLNENKNQNEYEELSPNDMRKFPV
jgi:hypothetical protein